MSYKSLYTISQLSSIMKFKQNDFVVLKKDLKSKRTKIFKNKIYKINFILTCDTIEVDFIIIENVNGILPEIDFRKANKSDFRKMKIKKLVKI